MLEIAFVDDAGNSYYLDSDVAELERALQACSFELGKLCLAHGDFSESAAKAIDLANAALGKGKQSG